MLMDPKKMSELIRMKKKKMMEAPPELVDTDFKPDMNPMDAYNMEQTGRIEKTLDTPEKINAENAEMDEDGSIGLSPEDKKRMGRLRSYFDTLDIE